MGTQQFGTGTILLDMTGMNRVIGLNAERGMVEVEAGIEWPQLLDYLNTTQAGREKQGGILQKTDRGRPAVDRWSACFERSRPRLEAQTIIDQVESFSLMMSPALVEISSKHEHQPRDRGRQKLSL